MHEQARAAQGKIGEDSTWVGVPRRIVDIGIACILFVAPLAMGGRYPIGRLVFIGITSVVAISWCLEKALSRRQTGWTWSGAELIWGLAILLVVVQLIPLSPSWLQFLAPHTSQLLPLWTHSDPAVSTWPTWDLLSLSPPATRGGLAMLLAYVMLFSVVTQHVRQKQGVERILRTVALAGIGMATLGLLQYFAGNGKFLWFYEHPSRDTLIAVKGTFANENHFAHFLALTIGPLLWWIVKSHAADDENNRFAFRPASASKWMPKSQTLLAIGFGTILLAGLLTYSRGGIAMLLLAAVVSTVLFALQGKVSRRAVLATATGVLVSLSAIWIHGQELLVREIKTIQTVDIESLDAGRSRRKIWSAVSRAIPDFAYLGCGVGALREVYPTYFNEHSTVEYSHAESGYLQVLVETGVPGFALLMGGIGLSGFWLLRALRAWKNTEVVTLAVPVAAAWCVSIVHALVDFNWFIPANMSLTLILISLAMRLSFLATRQVRERRINVPRLGWVVATSAAILTLFLGVRHYVGPARASRHWDEYLAWSLAANRFDSKSIGPGRQRRLGLVDGSSPAAVMAMTKQLHEVLRHDPWDARANIRMAAMCLRQFEVNQAASDNAMTLAQIRDAALSSDFASPAEMSRWVTRAVGDNRVLLDLAQIHAKRGLRLCPLQGRGFLYLGEVAFLDETLDVTEYDLLRQAYAVRPFDPSIQFAFGRQKLLNDDMENAITLWKEAFRRGVGVRQRIISAIGHQASPAEIMAVFDPDLDGLKDLFAYYRREKKSQALNEVGAIYVAQLEQEARLLSGESASRLWFDAQDVHSVLGNAAAAADAALNCVMTHPRVYRNHFACALRLRDAGRLHAALKEFRWCQSRRPDDPTLPRVVMNLQRELRQNQALRPISPPRSFRG